MNLETFEDSLISHFEKLKFEIQQFLYFRKNNNHRLIQYDDEGYIIPIIDEEDNKYQVNLCDCMTYFFNLIDNVILDHHGLESETTSDSNNNFSKLYFAHDLAKDQRDIDLVIQHNSDEFQVLVTGLMSLSESLNPTLFALTSKASSIKLIARVTRTIPFYSSNNTVAVKQNLPGITSGLDTGGLMWPSSYILAQYIYSGIFTLPQISQFHNIINLSNSSLNETKENYTEFTLENRFGDRDFSQDIFSNTECKLNYIDTNSDYTISNKKEKSWLVDSIGNMTINTSNIKNNSFLKNNIATGNLIPFYPDMSDTVKSTQQYVSSLTNIAYNLESANNTNTNDIEIIRSGNLLSSNFSTTNTGIPSKLTTRVLELGCGSAALPSLILTQMYFEKRLSNCNLNMSINNNDGNTGTNYFTNVNMDMDTGINACTEDSTGFDQTCIYSETSENKKSQMSSEVNEHMVEVRYTDYLPEILLRAHRHIDENVLSRAKPLATTGMSLKGELLNWLDFVDDCVQRYETYPNHPRVQLLVNSLSKTSESGKKNRANNRYLRLDHCEMTCLCDDCILLATLRASNDLKKLFDLRCKEKLIALQKAASHQISELVNPVVKTPFEDLTVKTNCLISSTGTNITVDSNQSFNQKYDEKNLFSEDVIICADIVYDAWHALAIPSVCNKLLKKQCSRHNSNSLNSSNHVTYTLCPHCPRIFVSIGNIKRLQGGKAMLEVFLLHMAEYFDYTYQLDANEKYESYVYEFRRKT